MNKLDFKILEGISNSPVLDLSPPERLEALTVAVQKKTTSCNKMIYTK